MSTLTIDPEKIYYRENSLKWEEKDSLPDLIARPIVVDIVNKLATEGMTSLLDIGCGTGRWTKIFSRSLKTVVGIDVINEMIQICRERNSASNITYHQDNIFALSKIFREGQFDIVTALMVLQYAGSKKGLSQLCNDVKHLLKGGGHFIFLVSHPFAILTRRSEWDKYTFDEPASYFQNFPFSGKIRLTDNDLKNVGAIFHSIEEYINSVIDGGLQIIQVYEPRPSEILITQYPDMIQDTLTPTCLIVHARK